MNDTYNLITAANLDKQSSTDVSENGRRVWWNSARGIQYGCRVADADLDIRWWVLLHEFLALLYALLQLWQALLHCVHLRLKHLAESQHLLDALFLYKQMPITMLVSIRNGSVL